MKNLLCSVTASALLAMAVSTVARADPLPTSLLTVTANDNTLQGLPPLIANDINSNGSALATGSGGLDPSVTASATTSETSDHNSAEATFTYYFQLVGSPNKTVPLIAQGNISSSLNVYNEVYDESFAIATLQIFPCGGITNGACNTSPSSPSGQVFAASSPSGYLGVPAATGTFLTGFDVTSDTIYEVYMDAQVDTVDSLGTRTASAVVDPAIFIDPAFDNADLFQLSFSDAVGSVPSTPLPGALPLFASGLGTLGFMGWRRRRKQNS